MIIKWRQSVFSQGQVDPLSPWLGERRCSVVMPDMYIHLLWYQNCWRNIIPTSRTPSYSHSSSPFLLLLFLLLLRLLPLFLLLLLASSSSFSWSAQTKLNYQYLSMLQSRQLSPVQIIFHLVKLLLKPYTSYDCAVELPPWGSQNRNIHISVVLTFPWVTH